MDRGGIEILGKIVSIDPGGFELGIAFWKDGILQSTATFRREEKSALDRRKAHYQSLEPILRSADLIICEEPFIRGAGNTNMQRMLGVFEWLTNFRLNLINPMTVKKMMGGGQLEKKEVAQNTLSFLSEPEKRIVQELILQERWNETDAVAVCLAWNLKQKGESQMAKSTMKNKSGNKSAKMGKSGMGKTNMPKTGKGKGKAC